MIDYELYREEEVKKYLSPNFFCKNCPEHFATEFSMLAHIKLCHANVVKEENI